MKTFVAALAMTIAAPAPAQVASTTLPSSPATIIPTPAAIALGREIAALLNSDEITQIQFDKAFAETMPKALLANPDVAALEAKYPGLVAYMLNQSRPLMEKNAIQHGPELINRLAAIYASELSESEMRSALIFYRSPTGTWLIGQVAHGMDFSAMMGKVVDNPDAKVSGGDFGAAINRAIPGVAAGMTEQRQKELVAFITGPAGRKLRALNPRLLAAAATWANESDAKYDAALEAVMTKAIADYIAQHGGLRVDEKTKT